MKRAANARLQKTGIAEASVRPKTKIPVVKNKQHGMQRAYKYIVFLMTLSLYCQCNYFSSLSLSSKLM